MRTFAIIGNGITGISAATELRRQCADRIVVISSESRHAYARTALMYIYMGNVRYEDTKLYEDGFWEKNRIELKYGQVSAVRAEAKELIFEDGSALSYDSLLIASGSQPLKLGCSGDACAGVQGLYSLADLVRLQEISSTLSRAVVVGGGLIGVELAEMLRARGISVTLLVRDDHYWGSILPAEEAALVEERIIAHDVDLRLGTQVTEIRSDAHGRVSEVLTTSGERIPCNFVGVTIGVTPNVSFLNTSGIALDRGVLVDRQLCTNVAGVFAAGDCAQFAEPISGRRAIEQVWYTGKQQGIAAARNMLGTNVPYEPALWFNSAKFFDLEYQTYGDVLPRDPEHIQSIYWRDPKRLRSLRVCFDRTTRAVKGFLFMGIRARHAVCEAWLLDNTAVDEVVANMSAAAFDPEFFPTYEAAIAELAPRYGIQANLKGERGLFSAYLKRFLSSERPRALTTNTR